LRVLNHTLEVQVLGAPAPDRHCCKPAYRLSSSKSGKVASPCRTARLSHAGLHSFASRPAPSSSTWALDSSSEAVRPRGKLPVRVQYSGRRKALSTPRPDLLAGVWSRAKRGTDRGHDPDAHPPDAPLSRPLNGRPHARAAVPHRIAVRYRATPAPARVAMPFETSLAPLAAAKASVSSTTALPVMVASTIPSAGLAAPAVCNPCYGTPRDPTVTLQPDPTRR
jgi:hypothetical protein